MHCPMTICTSAVTYGTNSTVAARLDVSCATHEQLPNLAAVTNLRRGPVQTTEALL